MNKEEMYRSIPKVDMLLQSPKVRTACALYGRTGVLQAVREETDSLRVFIRETEEEEAVRSAIASLPERIADRAEAMFAPHLRRVINGTGTILHTNLGRAPLGRQTAEKAARTLGGYCNLEYDLESGGRGRRSSCIEELLQHLTGAEAAVVVNNNAAAVLLILDTLARGGETVISRGELVEIGGSFRMPDVCEKSGTHLAEVGTTNKTHLRDYEAAVNENTKAILKVHTSNYAVVGFTESVSVEQLRPLADRTGLPLIADLGSGALIDLSQYGLRGEPTVQALIRQGADLVCFSADKLLGGPQAGLIIGRRQYVDRIRKNPLMRALRIGKFTASALEDVLREYQSAERALRTVPVLKMITAGAEAEAQRAGRLAQLLKKTCPAAEIEVRPCESQIGGGSFPLERLKSRAVVLHPHNLKAEELEQKMRRLRVPVIARLREDAVWLDVRTIEDDDFELLAQMLGEVLA